MKDKRLSEKTPITEAVLFDFDGTLAIVTLDFPAMRRAVVQRLGAYGIPCDGLDRLYVLEMIEAGRRWAALRDPETGERFALETMDIIQNMELQAAAGGRLQPGVKDMLQKLRRLGIRTGVITRNCSAAVETVFPDIHRFVDVVLTRDAVALCKPNPAHLRLALDTLGAIPSQSYMVGDHPMDIFMGRSVGTRTVGVLGGTSGRKELLSAGADIVVSRVADILTCIV